jgi:O-antigen ligase
LKWVGLAILVSSIWPASVWLRKNADKLRWACFLIGFLPFVTHWYHLLAAPISWPEWVGYAKGVEIQVVDATAIVILISLRGGLVRPIFVVPMILYFISALIATFGAKMPEAATFYCWQLLRVFVVYLAVANACAFKFETVASILKGFAAAEIFECAIAIWQRFGQHVLQTPGTLGSQNELGIASHFVIFPFFALMLGGRRGWLPPTVVLAGLVADVLTTSRGAVVLGLAGLGLVWLFSSLARFSPRKLNVALLGLAALALLAPLAIGSFDQRFRSGKLGLSEDTERQAFKRAAWMMIADHPGGVGPNNFAFVANVDDYYGRSGPDISNRGRTSNVHNLYILILAETGPMGLASYILMLLVPFVAALRRGLWSGSRDTDDPRRDILIGASVTLLIVYIHSTEEWVMIVATLEYLLAILLGLIAGLTAKEKALKVNGAGFARSSKS